MSNKPKEYKAYEYTGDSLVYSIIEVDEILAEKDKEIAELKAKLENVQASMYADVVDANMENRRLKRALYKVCANWAESERYTEATWHGDEHREELWAKVQDNCLKKAEEYK